MNSYSCCHCMCMWCRCTKV